MTPDSIEKALARDEYPIELLNAISSDYFTWEPHRARKSHIDEFGDEIKPGDTYYSRALTPAFEQSTKISSHSMHIVLKVVFEQNQMGISLAKHFIKKANDRLMNTFAEMNEDWVKQAPLTHDSSSKSDSP